MNTIQTQESKIELLKKTLCKDISSEEFEIFLHACRRTGLDPFMKQIYAIKRGNNMTIQTSIDGYRVVADRTGHYAPGKASEFKYDEEGNLISATAHVMKRTSDGIWHDVSAEAFWAEYVQSYNGKPATFWAKMPHVMLAKVAEALALRKAFPADLSGIYTQDEMNQADTIEVPKEEETAPDETLSNSDIYLLAIQLCDRGVENIDNVRSLIAYLESIKQFLKKPVKDCLEDLASSEKFKGNYEKWKGIRKE